MAAPLEPLPYQQAWARNGVGTFYSYSSEGQYENLRGTAWLIDFSPLPYDISIGIQSPSASCGRVAGLSRQRYWTASAMCCGWVEVAPSRSAIVRATRSTESCARAERPRWRIAWWRIRRPAGVTGGSGPATD